MPTPNPCFLFAADPQVGRRFFVTFVVEGDDAAGNPKAVPGRKFQIFCDNTIIFERHEAEIVMDPARLNRGEVTFTSRDGFQVDGDLKLWVQDLLYPTFHEETVITVAPAARTTPPPLPPAAAAVPPPPTPPTPPPPPPPPPSPTPPPAAPTSTSSRWAKFGDALRFAGSGLMTGIKLIGWPRTKKALEWIVITVLAYSIYHHFSIEGIGSVPGWLLVIATLLGGISYKGGRHKLGWLIAACVLVFSLASVSVTIIGAWYTFKQIAQNGATSPVPPAPQIPAPPTPIEKAIKKALEPKAPVGIQADPTATADPQAPPVVTKPDKGKKKKPPRTGPHYIPSL